MDSRPTVLAAWQTCATFALVTLAWVFFRASSLRDAVYVLRHLSTGLSAQIVAVTSHDTNAIGQLLFLGFEPSRIAIAALAVLSLIAVERRQRSGSLRTRIAAAPMPIRWMIYSAAVLYITTLGVFQGEKFIYFQF